MVGFKNPYSVKIYRQLLLNTPEQIKLANFFNLKF